jgi:hypothetical protein
MKFIPNFAEVKDGNVRIRHLSTSSTIEIMFEDEINGTQAIYIEYHELDSLIKCIEQIKKP